MDRGSMVPDDCFVMRQLQVGTYVPKCCSCLDLYFDLSNHGHTRTCALKRDTSSIICIEANRAVVWSSGQRAHLLL